MGALVDSRKAEPTWEIAHLFPPQGMWSEEEYLDLNTNRLVEFSDGTVDVLPMPTISHQLIALFLYRLLEAFVAARELGTVLAAPFRVRLRARKYREPDIAFVHREHNAWINDDYWDGADLVMEVLSEDDPQRDLRIKRQEYARAKIPEYWIVDPRPSTITVLRLAGKRYVAHGQFVKGDQAASLLLPGFQVDVSEVFARGLPKPAKANRKRRRKP